MSVVVSAESTTPPPPNAAAILGPPPGSFHRLSLSPFLRIPLYFTVTGITGFLLGVRKGGEEAGLRFRAEHAHKIPQSQTAWYLWHKSKNYHVALGGLYEGIRNSWRLAPWAGLFALMEEEIDRGRAAVVREWRSHRDGWDGEDMATATAGNKDFVSTTLAMIFTAGTFAAWKRMPLPTAVRLMKMGAKVGFGFGLAQDAVNLLRGRRLGYVELVRRYTFGTSGMDDVKELKAAAG